MPEMLQADRAELTRLCGGKIPPETEAKYYRYQKELHSRHSGRPMDLIWLLVIADSTHALFDPPKEPHKCDQWPLDCCVVASDFNTHTELCQGTFKGIAEDGQVLVALHGMAGHTLPYSAKQVRRLEILPDWYKALLPPEPPTLPPEPEVRQEVAKPNDARPEKPIEQYLAEKIAVHPFRSISLGTRCQLAVPMTELCQGWFVEIDRATSHLVVVRWPTGEQRAVDRRYVVVMTDETGKPWIDLDGFVSSGGVLPPPPPEPIVAVAEDEDEPAEDDEDEDDIEDGTDADALDDEEEDSHRDDSGAPKEGWELVAHGTYLTVRLADRKPVGGWFDRAVPGTGGKSIKVRLNMRGGRVTGRDKTIVGSLATIAKDKGGNPIVDVEGFIEAGKPHKQRLAEAHEAKQMAEST